MQLGRRKIYVRYGASMATSKLRIPAAKTGTARNMNTVAALAAMAAQWAPGLDGAQRTERRCGRHGGDPLTTLPA